VVGMRSIPGNPYDGHTPFEALEQVAILTDCQPKEVFVDLGYRAVDVQPGTKPPLNSSAKLHSACGATSGNNSNRKITRARLDFSQRRCLLFYWLQRYQRVRR